MNRKTSESIIFERTLHRERKRIGLLMGKGYRTQGRAASRDGRSAGNVTSVARLSSAADPVSGALSGCGTGRVPLLLLPVGGGESCARLRVHSGSPSTGPAPEVAGCAVRLRGRRGGSEDSAAATPAGAVRRAEGAYPIGPVGPLRSVRPSRTPRTPADAAGPTAPPYRLAIDPRGGCAPGRRAESKGPIH